jgi:acetyltransferase-like isoleucine patch superfamily enzyme
MMKTLIQKIIQLRNPAFRFDDALNSAALFQFMFVQAIALMRGLRLLFLLKNPKGALLGRGVRFFNASRIQFGKFLKLGDQVYVSALATDGVFIGDRVGIGAFGRIVVSTSLHQIGSFIRIGNDVGIGEFAYLGGAGGLEIGDNTIVGQYFSCHPENHNYQDVNDLIRHQGVTRAGIQIGSNCWIGSKVTVLDGVTIGNGCVIAAGTVVTKSFPANCVIGGVPSRLLKMRIKDA